MDKGGDGPSAPQSPSKTTVTQSALPEYAEPYFTRLMDKAETETLKDYTPYEESRIADFGTDTQGSLQQYRNVAGGGTAAGMTGAQNRMTTGMGFASGDISSGYDPNAVTTGTFDQAAADQYMNPYIENVLNRQKSRASDLFNERQVGRDAAAVRAGAFSGDRRYVQDAIAERELAQQMADIDAQGLSSAYQQAQGMFTSDQARNLQAGIASEGFEQQRGIQDIQAGAATEEARAGAEMLGQRAGEGLAGLSTTEQSQALQRAQALGGVGAAEDQMSQAHLDQGYADFINQRDYPRQQLNFMSGILRGVPISAQQEITQYEAPASSTAQLLGLGVGGAGIYKALKGT